MEPITDPLRFLRRLSVRFPSFVPVLAVVLVGGCRETNSPDSELAIRDSAGVPIIESSEPLLPPGSWTVSPEPVLQIGEMEGDDPYLFSRIPFANGTFFGGGGVKRLPDGRIMILNGMDWTIRFFDPNGKFISQFGGEGDGPGEFRSDLMGCSLGENGITIVSWNHISFFDDQGSFIESVPIRARSMRRFHGVFPDGSFLVQIYPPDYNPSAFDPGLHTEQRQIKTVGADGGFNDWTLTVNSYVINSVEEDGRRINGHVPFSPSLRLLPLGDQFVYGWGDSYELQVFDRNGNLKRIIRRTWIPVPVTEQDRERVQTDVIASHYPAFDQILSDAQRNLWVRRGNPPNDWDVFDPSGQWITTTPHPRDVLIHDIGEDYILGVWWDEMYVEYVRMYALDRSG